MAGYAETALVSSMRYLAESQAAIANNLANVNSTGFKRRMPIAEADQNTFAQMLQRHLPTTHFTEQSDWSGGNLVTTGDHLHVALEGPGHFMVQDESGQRYYTRNGSMKLDAAGHLVNQNGQYFLDAQGQKIVVDTRGTDGLSEVRISPNGQIDLGFDDVGQLGVFKAPVNRLVPAGSSSYVDPNLSPKDRPVPLPTPNIRQGSLEGSNVNSLTEMIQMISVQRSFQASGKALQTIGRMQSSYISAVNR